MKINATILGQTISFFLFVFFCAKYIWPNIIRSIKIRQEEIDKSFKLAKNIKIRSLEIEKIAQNKINMANKKAIKILENAQSDRILILEAAILNAEQKRKVIVAEGIKKLNLKKNKILTDLQKETSNLSIFIAKKILKEYVKKNNVNKIFEKKFKI
ncbi:F0F1 ATP synthase subunit B [Buchnera aphidicola (Astegopteryx bambusae)]|uniref:F0F1 ATP synthase subunit B n=1 Tax=Buchnera aphidicola TaxID=9 RepID=UPI0031B8644D